MPTDFSLEAAKAGNPSISEIGYVMILNMQKGASSEMTEGWSPLDDLAHSVRADFLTAEPEKFTRDVLNLADTQAQPHQLGAERHHTAAHQLGEAAAAAGDRVFRARDIVDQGLNFVGWSLIAKEIQDDADGLFCHSIADAGLCGQPSNQF